MKNMRKGFALLVSVVLLLSMLSAVAFAEGTALLLNTPSAVEMVMGEYDIAPVELTFTPAESGNYIFYTTDDTCDPYVILLDSERNEIAYSDDVGLDYNFQLGYDMTAGETYTLQCCSYNEGSYEVTAILSPVASVEVKDHTIIEDTFCWETNDYDEDIGGLTPNYTCYEVSDPDFTVTFKDHTVKNSTDGKVIYNGLTFELSNISTDQAYTNQWTVGNTYNATAELYGASDSFKVSIVESPVASVQVDKIYLVEDFNGSVSYEEYEGEPVEYFNYYLGDITYTVTLKDQTVLESEYGEVVYNGDIYTLDLEINQSYETRWLKGNTYDLNGTVMGAAATAQVEIIESPFVSVEEKDITLIEGVHCWSDSYFDNELEQEVYFNYYYFRPEYTVTLKDGSVLESDMSGGILYKGTYYEPSIVTDQTPDNQWTVGNTYTATGDFGGIPMEFKVTIVPFPFTDVAEDAYYHDAVYFALESGITTGTTATTFGPTEVCERGQVVTFLWRAAGCPEPTTTEMPFTDVAEDAYYRDAVLWAVENEITTGTSATTFGPTEVCERGQIATFLWRAAGCPEPATTEMPFTDVAEGLYCYDAILWAVENGITNGTTATTFSPFDKCERGQIVTFLYRAIF